MHSFFTLSLVIGLSSITLAQTPLTLNNTNMPNNTDTLRYTNAQLSSLSNYTATGLNFNWNFSSLVPLSQGLREFKSPLATPYAIFFLSFTGSAEKVADTLVSIPLIVSLTNYYLFYRKSNSNPNAYLADGAGLSVAGIPLPSYYSDKDELYNFPMTYPKYDSTTFRFSTPNSTLTPFVYSSNGTRATRVDGWGTITTPFGTAPCLRLVSNVYAKDSIKTAFFPIAFTNNTRSYQWLTNVPVNGKNIRIPMLEVSGSVFNGSFTPTQVRYRDNFLTTLPLNNETHLNTVAFYPNPVNDHLYFNSSEQLNGVSLRIFDVNGKEVYQELLTKQNSGNTGSLVLSHLSPGIYTVKLQKEVQTDVFKFIKQ